MDFETVYQNIERLRANIEKVMVGKREVVDLAITCLLAEGHLLVEDVPGVGKSMLAKSIARSLEANARRIQFTPDLLPSDITGTTLYNQKDHSFTFKPGPVFGHIILADEINRATPRTQSSLLEAMEEKQVTVDGETHPLESPFFVIGTQNPIEFEGTYPLPISQLDRFMMKTSFGYLKTEDEVRMLRERKEAVPIDELAPVMGIAAIREMQATVRQVKVEDSLYDYVVGIVSATRRSDQLALGASPRTTLRLFRAAQATALLDRRAYMIPDDVKAVARPVLAHRVIVKAPVQYKGQPSDSVLTDILNQVPVPY
ncbi:MAG: MoxR family ATPase [Kiritimatiellae bacterium]|nr:MoxR family ATPase [Kiritimatiellia bacterium]